jgi:6,7-dimethyl-8-ribityllumazine synthase
MLTKIADTGTKQGGTFAIVAAKYNPVYSNALVAAAERELMKSEATIVETIRVPGSFEVPVVAAKLAKSITPKFDAIICFGVILRGQTTHAQQIADGVTMALARIQVDSGTPIVHGVLLFENEEQAKVRCLGDEHNRGLEAARVALEMAGVMRDLARFNAG